MKTLEGPSEGEAKVFFFLNKYISLLRESGGVGNENPE